MAKAANRPNIVAPLRVARRAPGRVARVPGLAACGRNCRAASTRGALARTCLVSCFDISTC